MGRVITLSEQWRKKYEYHKFKSLRPEPFKSEKLEIDYITLNISMKGEIDPESTGRYLLVYGFNSTIQESEKIRLEIFFIYRKNTDLLW
jgi:hypothetical protein